MSLKTTGILLALASIVPALAQAEPPIKGAGSTAAAPIYAVWAESYRKVSETQLDYDAIGSGGGMARIRERKVDFGASDVSPTAAELQKDGPVAIPAVGPAAVPVVNVPGVGQGQLRLTGELLARIFMGEVAAWTAPEIRELNPKLKLPATPIRVVVRADGSGTTYHFTDYLAKVSPEWAKARGVKSQLEWPAQFIAVKGSGEVARALKATSGAIGYIDYNYVVDQDLSFAQMR